PTAVPTAVPTTVPTLAPTAVPTAVPTMAPTAIPTAVPFTPAWVQALRPIPLWSGPDDNAEQLGAAARWDYFLILNPQAGSRLQVQVARTKNFAWIDALLVGPSGPPPPDWPPASQ